MDRRWIEIESIQFVDRMRKVDEAKAREIADSILENGLMNPPAVRLVEEMEIDGEMALNVPVLIAGRHRLRALEMLGETAVECAVYDVSEDEAIIMEADENLARHELEGAARTIAIGRREKAWKRKRDSFVQKMDETSKLSKRGRPEGRPTEFATETADKSGLARSLIYLELARYDAIGEERLNRMVGTSLDSGAEMDATAKLVPEAQEEVVSAAASGRKVSARLRNAPAKEDNALEEILRSAVDTYGREAVYGVFQVFKMNPRQAVKIADRLFAA